MKKIYTLLLILPLIALVFAFTGGPDAGYAGSPLDGQNCTSCHQPGPATSVTNWIGVSVGANGYVPGETYSVTVTAMDIVAEKMGFQITSETAGAKAGTWVITDATRTQLKGGTAVTHTAAGTATTGSPNTWTMDWTAPAEGTGAVSFYVAVNKTNADNSNQGDEIYVSSLTVQESNVGIAENLDRKIGIAYPNPARDYIMLDVPSHSQISIIDNNGRTVVSYQTMEALQQIDVSDLSKGIYYLLIAHQGQQANRKFVKR